MKYFFYSLISLVVLLLTGVFWSCASSNKKEAKVKTNDETILQRGAGRSIRSKKT